MAKVDPYHTILDTDKPHKVYHDQDNCPAGQQIREKDRVSGTGGRDRCWDCRKIAISS